MATPQANEYRYKEADRPRQGSQREDETDKGLLSCTLPRSQRQQQTERQPQHIEVLAARQVGDNGFVIGVDMTDEMLEKARANAAAGNYANVDFRKGLIEELPVDDGSVDVIISNCVVNLSPEKDRVFREARRVLKPGGRMMISDVVLEKPLPREVRENVAVLVGCIANASLRSDYLEMIRNAGFTEIRIVSEANFGRHLDAEMPLLKDLAAETGVSQEIIEESLDSVTSLSLLIR